MNLEKINERVYYIPNPANIGVIKDGKKAILIDSGLDDDTARKILKTLKKEQLYPKAVINTHSHADHCGGNAYLKEKARVQIYAPEIESGIIESPYLEPLYLFSGASPIKDLKNKFLMARPSKIDYVIKTNEKKLFFNEVQLEIIRLLGHSPNQIGVVIDDILFCADSVFSKDVLKRHKVPFYIDIDDQKETLKFLRESIYKFYVPSHANPTDDITELSDANLEVITNVEKCLTKNIIGRKTTEQILKKLCDHYKIEIKTVQQYYLMKTLTMGYLSSLHKRKIFEFIIKENTLYWSKI